jgi:hypothetical protein
MRINATVRVGNMPLSEKVMLKVMFMVVAALSTSLACAQAVAPPKAAKAGGHASPTTAAPYEPGLQPKAIAILKAASARLAASKSMAFTAVVSEEGPSLLGLPLIYSTKSQVTLRRPDRLKVVTLGDGPPSEFYYDGKQMMAFAPEENLLAVADAPATIDATLVAAYEGAEIYFPFTDLIVADPYKDMAGDLKTAFYIGQSHVVDGITTDMVGFATKDVFAQIWVGADDKLPRRLYAVYLNDPARLRHVVELSNWELDKAVPDDAFHSSKAGKASRIAFNRPDGVASGKPPSASPATTP